MGKVLLLMFAALAGVWTTREEAPSAVPVTAAPGMVIARDPSMPGCVRQMGSIIGSAGEAEAACDCVFAEAGYRGIDSGDFAQMSRITRSCARLHGAVLPS